MNYIRNSGSRTKFISEYGRVTYDIQQLPHCCGITLLHGFYFSRILDKGKFYKEFHDHLTSAYFGAGTWNDPGTYENEDAKQLNRCMLMAADAVGGEHGPDFASMYQLCKEHGWEESTMTPYNHNSANRIQVFLWNKEKESDSNS